MTEAGCSPRFMIKHLFVDTSRMRSAGEIADLGEGIDTSRKAAGTVYTRRTMNPSRENYICDLGIRGPLIRVPGRGRSAQTPVVAHQHCHAGFRRG